MVVMTFKGNIVSISSMNSLRLWPWKRIVLGVVLVIIVWWIWGWWTSRNDVEVDSVTAELGEIRETLILSGEVSADEHVSLTFAGSGLLSWVGVQEGDYVKQYQAVASLDQRSLQKNLEKQLSLYMTNRWDFEQTADDYESWPAAYSDMNQREEIQRILEKSQFGLDRAVIDVELADLSKRLAVLSSPINGVVTRVTPEYAGVNVGPTTAVFEIINPDTLFFEVTADQSEVVKLFEGQKVEITLDSFDDQTFTGMVKQIGFTPKQGEAGTVYEVTVMVPDILQLRNKLRMGMTGDAEFVVADKQRVVVIPQVYVRTDGEGDYIQISPEGEKRYVTLGLESDTQVEVMEGLSEGEEIFNVE